MHLNSSVSHLALVSPEMKAFFNVVVDNSKYRTISEFSTADDSKHTTISDFNLIAFGFSD